MVNKINIKLLLILFSALVLFAAFVAVFFAENTFENNVQFANADTGNSVVLQSLKGSYFDGVNGTSAIITERDYDGGYAANVTAVFRIEAPFYLFEYTIDGKPYGAEKLQAVPENGLVEFAANRTGRYSLICRAYNSENTSLSCGEANADFYNDAEVPVENGTAILPMTEFKRTGQEYIGTVDWSVFVDERSGIAGIYYYYDYGNNETSEIHSVDLSTGGKTNFTIKKRCEIKVVCYDRAGNGISRSYAMDGYDDAAPPIPNYTVTPSVTENGYANQYEIKVTFLEDNGVSGLKDIQSYSINGITYNFEAAPPVPESIILDKAIDYTVILYAADNAGNISESVKIFIPYSAFDLTPPVIDKVVRQIDISDERGICRIDLYANDKGESGISDVTDESGKLSFTKGAQATSEYYTAFFDCYGFGNEIVIIVNDNAGNKTRYILNFPYFSDTEISETVKKCAETLETTDFSLYTENAAKNINTAINKLNLLLSSENSAKTDILRAAEELTEKITESVSCSYVINSSPEYASPNITLEVTASDFTDYKKGSVITVALSKWEGEGKDYTEAAGFDKSFSDYFALNLTIDGESLKAPLNTGILVGMNKPTDYYDRDVAIIDASSGKKIDSEVKNNRIYFRVKGDTRYILVVEGGKAPTLSATGETDKTITVFGNEMNLSTFLWIVCGTGGVAIAAVIILIVIRKLRG